MIYFSASGGWIPPGPPSNFTPPYCDESWAVNTVPGLTHWKPGVSDVESEKIKLDKYHGTSGLQSYARYVNIYIYKYDYLYTIDFYQKRSI